jgi:DNA-binding CsgD family transcriptional regulator
VKNAKEAEFKAQKHKNFLSPLRDLLLQEVSQEFFEELLTFTMRQLPNAQAGSVMVLRAGRYHYVATDGYDLSELSNVTLNLEEVVVLAEPYQPVLTLNDFENYNKLLLDEERQEILEKFGRVSEIQETLLVPVRQQGQIAALLFVDNFERSNVFTKAEMARAEELGVCLGLAAKLWDYETRLAGYEQHKLVAKLLPDSDDKSIARVELCPREKDMLLHISEGLSNKEIAKELMLSEFTVRDYIHNLYQKIGVHSRKKAKEWARDNKHSWE